MAGETYLTIIGNLTADPEMRTTSNGGTVANLTIASTPRLFDRDSGQWEDGETLFMRCSAWDSTYSPMASNIQASLAKGMRVIARGRLEQRSYQDRDGNKRTVVEMRLDEIGPALTRNTAQVARNGNGQQQAPQQSQQWGGRSPAVGRPAGPGSRCPAAGPVGRCRQ
ncbi:single-stranded DNA-binding protein [Bifidobacterium sp. B4001]|uniref:single-stranded DNA-binding protein n=1 Tax=unclassified Bifidobacterium TaxID=2608897 RepID=UPI002A14098B|nr:single-stranded DNA-binding protein [Bifidobacterium sp. B4079]MCX8681412.1 single-stranded DNA-binding protein [Bifidobacterium sp. B4001]